MIDAILFDVNGTLVDHRQAVLDAVAELIATSPDVVAEPSELSDTWWNLERTHMERYLAGQCSFVEQRRQRLREFLPLLSEDVPDDGAGLDSWFANNYLASYEAAWRCYADVRDCLQDLLALVPTPLIVVVTNGDYEQQKAKLERFDLMPAMGRVLTPTHLGAAKPDSACFVAACKQLGVSPGRTAYVGDWLNGDAVAASDAGLIGIWLDRGVDPVNGAPTSPEDCQGLPVVRITSLRAHAGSDCALSV